jgi:hypothetical protein
MSKSIWADSDWRSLKVIIKLCSLLSKLKCYLQIVWCASMSFFVLWTSIFVEIWSGSMG